MPNKMRPGHGERAEERTRRSRSDSEAWRISQKLFEPEPIAPIDIVGKHFGFNLIDHDRMSWAARSS